MEAIKSFYMDVGAMVDCAMVCGDDLLICADRLYARHHFGSPIQGDYIVCCLFVEIVDGYSIEQNIAQERTIITSIGIENLVGVLISVLSGDDDVLLGRANNILRYILSRAWQDRY